MKRRGSRCPIVDTFWQTETGGHVITPCRGYPLYLVLPSLLPGIDAAVVDETGQNYQMEKVVCS